MPTQDHHIRAMSMATGGSDAASLTTLESVLRSSASLDEFTSLVADFLESDSGFTTYPTSAFTALDHVMEHLESRIFFATEVEELIFNLKREMPHYRVLQEAYSVWETTLEQHFVSRLRAGTVSGISDYRLANRLQRVVRREVSMLDHRPKRVLFIGSGPFPISAIWLNRILGVSVDGIDVAPAAVRESSSLMAAIGLEKVISLRHEPDGAYDVSDYDLIVIALLAKPKEQILENIHRTARKDCTVVCRTSFGLRSLLYEPTFVSHALLEKFSIQDMRLVQGAADDTVSSLRLQIRT